MDTITITKLQQMVDDYEPRTVRNEWGEIEVSGLYIRWSADPIGDCERGRSKNHANGQNELGLSVVETHYSQTYHGINTGYTLEQRVNEYSFLPGRPWVLEGWRLEDPALLRGSDNEPLVLDPKLIAWIEV